VVIRVADRLGVPGRYGLAPAHINLGACLLSRHRSTGDSRDAQDAATLLQEVVSMSAIPSSMRLAAARQRAAALATLTGPRSATDAYAFAITEVLPTLAPGGVGVRDQWSLIETYASSLGPDAAASAIDAGQMGLAVELLDRGRGVIWSQLLDLQGDLSEIRQAMPELARRLERCREELTSSARQAAAPDPEVIESELRAAFGQRSAAVTRDSTG